MKNKYNSNQLTLIKNQTYIIKNNFFYEISYEDFSQYNQQQINQIFLEFHKKFDIKKLESQLGKKKSKKTRMLEELYTRKSQAFQLLKEGLDTQYIQSKTQLTINQISVVRRYFRNNK